jgi:hypothetical protein
VHCSAEASPRPPQKITTKAILERHAKSNGNQTYGTTADQILTAAKVAQKWANTKACHCRHNQQLLNQASRKTRMIAGKSKHLARAKSDKISAATGGRRPSGSTPLRAKERHGQPAKGNGQSRSHPKIPSTECASSDLSWGNPNLKKP